MATVTITGNTIRGATTSRDNRVWQIRSIGYQPGGVGGGVITPGADWETLYPVDGVLSFSAESGSVADIKTPDEVPYRVRIPTSDAGLWDVIEAGVAYQPDVAQDNLNLAVSKAAPGFIAAELGQQTFDAINTDLESRVFGLLDDGEGGVVFGSDGSPTGGPSFPIPGAAWSVLAGAPGKLPVGTEADGLVDDRAALASSDDSALAVGLPLMLLPGTYRVGTGLTIDSPVWFTPGAVLLPDDGVTVTLAGGIAAAPPTQIFDTSEGGVVVVKRSTGLANWWGAVGDGVTDDTEALQAAIDAGPVFVPKGTYLVSALTLPSNASVTGAGIAHTIFKQKASSTTACMRTATDYVPCLRLHGFTIDGNRSEQAEALVGLHLDNSGSSGNHVAESDFNFGGPHHTVTEILVWNCSGTGIFVEGRGVGLYKRLWINNVDGHGLHIDGNDSHYSDLDIGVTGLCGIYMNGGSAINIFTNVKVWWTGVEDNVTYGQGLLLEGYCDGNTFTGLTIQAPGQTAIKLDDSPRNVFTSVNLLYPTPSGVDSVAVRVKNTALNQFVGVVVSGPSDLEYGIEFDGATTNLNTFIGMISQYTGDLYLLSNGADLDRNMLILNGERLLCGRLIVDAFVEAEHDSSANSAGVPLDGVYYNSARAALTKRTGTSVGVNLQTGTSYTFALGDSIVTTNNGSAVTLTVPPTADVAFPQGTTLDVTQIGAGQVTIAPGAGVTLTHGAGLKISAQGGSCRLVKIGAERWSVSGDLTT